METSKFLKDLQCITLKPLDSTSPKGALNRNYTTDISIRFTYPIVPKRYGILLKANNLLVIDIDKPDLKDISDFPETFTVKTRRGYHLYYWNYYKKHVNFKYEWGEIKTSGHVVGLGVQHESGFYTLFNSTSIQPISELVLPKGCVKRGGDFARIPLLPPSSHILDRIFMEEKRQEIEKILKSEKTDHNQRIWMVGFLYTTVGLTEKEILFLIDKENNWGDYNLKTTKNQIHSICKTKIGGMSYKPELVRGQKNRNETEVKMAEFKEIKTYDKIRNGSKWYGLVEIEGSNQDGETWQYHSLESGKLVKTTDGEEAYGIADKRFTLPKNKDTIDQIITCMKEIPSKK